jgi:serine/threonine protein phosphatase PrpC
MLYPIKACIISHLGYQRKNQEDNFLLNDGQYLSKDEQKMFSEDKHYFIRKVLSAKTDRAIFAVSDGLGGHDAGEVASFLAMTHLCREKEQLLSVSRIEDAIERFHICVSSMNQEICYEAKRDISLNGMGSTLASVVFVQGKAVGMNVGDSRIYKYNGDKLVQISKDHTVEQRLKEYNLIPFQEIEHLETRKALTRYLGIKEQEVKLKCSTTDIFTTQGREWFLLCSDGLSDVVTESMLEKVMSTFYEEENVEEAVHMLVKMALDGVDGVSGGNDNITAMIIEIQGPSLKGEENL